MTLQGVVVEYQYAGAIQKALDFLITSKKTFGFIIRALRTRIFKKVDYPHQRPIPPDIQAKVDNLGSMLDEPSFLLPMDPVQKKDKTYRLNLLKERSKFKTQIRRMTHDKICELRFMSYHDRNQLVAVNKQKQAAALLMKQKMQAAQTRPVVKTVESTEYVELRAQWRENLLFPIDEDGLTEAAFGNLAMLVDLDKLPWGHAQLLTANLELAKWLGNPAIFQLIYDGFLDYHNVNDLGILFEPNDTEMKNLRLLSPLILKGHVTIQAAIDVEIYDEDLDTLESEEFKTRVLTQALSEDDIAFLRQLNINVQIKPKVQNMCH